MRLVHKVNTSVTRHSIVVCHGVSTYALFNFGILRLACGLQESSGPQQGSVTVLHTERWIVREVNTVIDVEGEQSLSNASSLVAAEPSCDWRERMKGTNSASTAWADGSCFTPAARSRAFSGEM